jgi:energy-coupling factor transporter ATP-binding protein EcfA2
MPGRSYTMEELRNPPKPNVIEWDEFAVMFSRAHKQGEHIALVGPNGTGKTQLGVELCKIIGARTGRDGRPSRVTILNFKPRDDTVSAIQKNGDWPTIKEWPPGFGQEHCVVWPRGGPPSTAAKRHRAIFIPLLDTIYAEGGQTVYIPEAAYFERPPPAGLGMGGTMEQFWSTARSLKLTVISDTQRPRQVTRLMWSEPAWLCVFHVDDNDDLKRVAEMSGRQIEVWGVVPKLGGHEFLCIRRQRGKGQEVRELYVSRVDVTRDKRNNNKDRGEK